MQLYIGNKNYSSWSLRPWLLMTHLGIPFEEVKLRLEFSPDSAFKARIAAVSPAGRVPVLVDDDGFAVWESIAIVEYLAEKFPAAGVWPADARARARARSVCAEMHAGFSALRNACAMNLEADLSAVGRKIWDEQAAVRADVHRIQRLWADALRTTPEGSGPFLFGEFCAADAFFAPVCTRLRTYGLPIAPEVEGYVLRLLALPAMQAWTRDAFEEHDFLVDDEPYRTAPTPRAP